VAATAFSLAETALLLLSLQERMFEIKDGRRTTIIWPREYYTMLHSKSRLTSSVRLKGKNGERGLDDCPLARDALLHGNNPGVHS
jgi:hypothetical protein